MKDKRRIANKMVHVRFTDLERRKLKAFCAIQGMSMQELIRKIVSEHIAKKRKSAK